jgi:LacI family repressor for deo operon, udp, cdd, tsx, nupC, and nupG
MAEPARVSSMADVATLAGVSVSTVSRALRGSELVSPETTARVQAAAQELAFAVSRAASSLATGRLNRIAVLVSGSLGAWFNGTLLDVIYGCLHRRGYELMIFRTFSAEDRDEFFATLPARRNADALIVASLELTGAQRQRLHDLGMPLVYVNQTVRGSASVAIDDVAGGEVAARHLINLGHRRLAFVRNHPRGGHNHSSDGRLTGFHRAVRAARLPTSEQVVLSGSGNADGERIVGQLLAQSELPTGLVVESDELAFSLLAALGRVGLRVPADLSVIGFDDHAMAATFGLSTIAQPLDLLGHEAAALALALVDGERPRRRNVTAPTELRLRETTGRPPEPAQPN